MNNPDRILKLPEVRLQVHLSQATIWRKVKAGTFPAPRQLTDRAVGWLQSEVQNYLQSLPRTGSS
jgi:prophage regulatory protein